MINSSPLGPCSTAVDNLMASEPLYHLAGIGVGTGLTIAPLYTAELSPKKIRGALVSFTEVSINIGMYVLLSHSSLLV